MSTSILTGHSFTHSIPHSPTYSRTRGVRYAASDKSQTRGVAPSRRPSIDCTAKSTGPVISLPTIGELVDMAARAPGYPVRPGIYIESTPEEYYSFQTAVSIGQDRRWLAPDRRAARRAHDQEVLAMVGQLGFLGGEGSNALKYRTTTKGVVPTIIQDWMQIPVPVLKQLAQLIHSPGLVELSLSNCSGFPVVLLKGCKTLRSLTVSRVRDMILDQKVQSPEGSRWLGPNKGPKIRQFTALDTFSCGIEFFTPCVEQGNFFNELPVSPELLEEVTLRHVDAYQSSAVCRLLDLFACNPDSKLTSLTFLEARNIPGELGGAQNYDSRHDPRKTYPRLRSLQTISIEMFASEDQVGYSTPDDWSSVISSLPDSTRTIKLIFDMRELRSLRQIEEWWVSGRGSADKCGRVRDRFGALDSALSRGPGRAKVEVEVRLPWEYISYSSGTIGRSEDNGVRRRVDRLDRLVQQAFRGTVGSRGFVVGIRHATRI